MDPDSLVLEVRAPVPSSGRAVVLLHGFPFDHRMWDGVADDLVARWSVSSGEAPGLLLLDLPGLGASAIPSGRPSMAVAAQAVRTTLREAGVSQAAVVGMSMGGYVAFALAQTDPDLCAGLGLLDTKHTADEPDARRDRLATAATVEQTGSVDAVRAMASTLLSPASRRDRGDLQARAAELIDAQSPAGVAWSQRAMAAREDMTDVLRTFPRPVLVVIGAADEITPISMGEQMRQLGRDVDLVVLAGAGHLAAMERPASVALAVDGFRHRAFAGQA